MTNKEKYISSFSGVEPSDEIKERILNMTKPKRTHFKAVVAVFAVICVLATSASALTLPKLKEFTSGWFSENDTLTQDLHSEKNIAFDDDCNELDIICTDIMGDKNGVLVALDMTSKNTAEFKFDKDKWYLFDTCSVVFSDGTIGTVLSDVTFLHINESTLHAEFFVVKTGGQISAGNESICFEFNNFGYISEENEFENIYSEEFTANIDIDYTDSSEILNAHSDNHIQGFNYSIDSNGFVSVNKDSTINLTPVYANVSNISFNCSFESDGFEMNNFELLFGDLSEDDLFFENIRINLSDGTNIMYSASKQNDQCVLNAISFENNVLSVSGRFATAIDASLVESIEFNGITLFFK